MSFVSTFNSLSTNGWIAKTTSGTYSPIYILANTDVGHDVAMSEDGNYVIASNPDANSAGIVKVYTINNNVLLNQANVIGNVFGSNVITKFGTSIDIDYDGTRFIAGASANGLGNSAAGSARIYTRSGTSWSIETQINPPVSNTLRFGNVAVINNSGDNIAIGQNYFGGTDSVYTYSRSGTTWSIVANIHTPASNIFFGHSMAMDGNSTLVIGAPRANNNGTFSGAAYVYDCNGSLLTTLLASDGAANDNFGSYVGISNDGGTIVITAPGANSNVSAAYVYKGSGNTWTEVEKVIPFGSSGPFYGEEAGFTPQGVSGDGSLLALSTQPPTGATANYTSILTYIDSSTSNTYTSIQQIQYPAAMLFGSTVDLNYSGNLIITSAGNSTSIGNLILLGPV
jgi:hypothetical protein